MLGRLFLTLGLFGAVGCEPTNQGYAPTQPIAYSHALHAGGLQIPCQYCHFGAERGHYAGIPPTSVCMNCHKQVAKDHPEVQKVRQAMETNESIPWIRVHRLPDHVAFDHSVHVTAGVTCQTCHGPVETMARVEQWAPLTMGWCVDCHRQGGGEQIAQKNELVTGQATALTDCAVCHH